MSFRRSLTLAALFAAALGATAAAGPSTGDGGRSSARGTPHVTYDAVVDKAGTLQKGTATSAFAVSKGVYIVEFPVVLTSCVYVGTLGRATKDGGVPARPGMITVVRSSGFSNGVFVETFDRHAHPHDYGFHLVVAC